MGHFVGTCMTQLFYKHIDSHRGLSYQYKFKEETPKHIHGLGTTIATGKGQPIVWSFKTLTDAWPRLEPRASPAFPPSRVCSARPPSSPALGEADLLLWRTLWELWGLEMA